MLLSWTVAYSKLLALVPQGAKLECPVVEKNTIIKREGGREGGREGQQILPAVDFPHAGPSSTLIMKLSLLLFELVRTIGSSLCTPLKGLCMPPHCSHSPDSVSLLLPETPCTQLYGRSVASYLCYDDILPDPCYYFSAK